MFYALQFSALTPTFPNTGLSTCTPLPTTAAVGMLTNVISTIIPYVIAMALIFFIWGILQGYVSEDEQCNEEAVGARFSWGVMTFVLVFLLVGVSYALEYVDTIPVSDCVATTPA